MGARITERGSMPVITHDHEARLHINLSTRWTVARVQQWSLRDGMEHDVLAADEAKTKDYHYMIEHPCDVMVYVDSGARRLFEHFYHWDGERVEEADEELFAARWRARHPVRFGDIRSAVARAMEATSHEEFRPRWRLCRQGLIWMDEAHPEFDPALRYVMDHLDRFLEREAMVKLDGSKSQQQWARRVRLRTIQRLGLLHDDHTDMRARIDCKFARLSARIIPESGVWIGASDALKESAPHEIVSWLLSDWHTHR